jgi:hypothetical protein
MAMGGSNMQNACKCCTTHPRQQSTYVDSLGRSGLVQLLQLAAEKHNDTTMTKQLCQSSVDDDGDNGNGGDSGNDCDGDGDGDDSTAAADGDDVDDNDSGVLRTAIGQRRLDDDDGTTMMAMGGQQHAECLQVLRHPLEATINQCGQFEEEQMRGGGDLRG